MSGRDGCNWNNTSARSKSLAWMMRSDRFSGVSASGRSMAGVSEITPTRIVAPCVSGCLHPLHQTWPQLAMRPATDQRADVLERDAGFGKINEYGRIGERFQR